MIGGATIRDLSIMRAAVGISHTDQVCLDVRRVLCIVGIIIFE